MALNVIALRVYALGLAHRAIKDIRRDNFRQLRNYVDMCALLSKSKGHQLFFERAQQLLETTDSLYYPLIQRAISSISEDALCTFGVNLGIDALTHGVTQLRREGETGGLPGPWLTVTPPDAPGLSDEIGERERCGQYLWVLPVQNAAQAEAALALAAAHEKSDFALLLRPELVTPALRDRLLPRHNLVTVLQMDGPEIGETLHEAVLLLKNARLFYGMTLALDDASVQQVLQPEWMSVMAQHTLFCVYTHPALSQPAAAELTRQIFRMRLTTGAPVLPLLWEEDMAYIGAAICPGTGVEERCSRGGKTPL